MNCYCKKPGIVICVHWLEARDAATPPTRGAQQTPLLPLSPLLTPPKMLIA